MEQILPRSLQKAPTLPTQGLTISPFLGRVLSQTDQAAVPLSWAVLFFFKLTYTQVWPLEYW